MKHCSNIVVTGVSYFLICFRYHGRISYPKITQIKFAIADSVITVNLYYIYYSCYIIFMFSVIKLEPLNNTVKLSMSKLAMFPVHLHSWLTKAGKDWWMIITLQTKPDKTCFVWLWLTQFGHWHLSLSSELQTVRLVCCLFWLVQLPPPCYCCTHAFFPKGLYICIRNNIN
jgi:hypothetical protein